MTKFDPAVFAILIGGCGHQPKQEKRTNDDHNFLTKQKNSACADDLHRLIQRYW